MMRLASRLEGLDDMHATTTTRARAAQRSIVIGGSVLDGWVGDGCGELLSSSGDRLGFGAAREQAVMADAMESLRQDVE